MKLIDIHTFLLSFEERVTHIVKIYDEKVIELGQEEADDAFEQGCAAAIVLSELGEHGSLNTLANSLAHRTAMELSAFYLDLRRNGVIDILQVRKDQIYGTDDGFST